MEIISNVRLNDHFIAALPATHCSTRTRHLLSK